MTRQNDAVNPVAAAREAQALSREGLAFKAHVSLKTIERIEAGLVRPHRLTRHAIAEALGCTVDDLFPLEQEVA